MGYADDASRWGEEAKEVQKLQSVCEKFGDDWEINFSGHKSKFICFGTQRNDKTEFVLKGGKNWWF